MTSETTATMLIGPVTSYMGGTGSMRAQTLLVLDEGSRASWRIVELDEPNATITAVANAPRHLLAHGLLAFLASRRDEAGLAVDSRLAPLARRSANGRRLETRMVGSAAPALAEAFGTELAIVITLMPGSTVKPGEVAALRALGVRIEDVA